MWKYDTLHTLQTLFLKINIYLFLKTMGVTCVTYHISICFTIQIII